MKVGDTVIAKGGRELLFCGSGMYGCAVVASLDPFILISEEADMRWGTLEAKDFEVAPNHETHPDVKKAVMERLYRDFPDMKPKNKITSTIKEWMR